MRNTWIFFGSCAGNATFEPLIQNMIRILEGARETILAQGLLEQAYFDAGIEGLNVWARRPDAALWFSICWAEGAKL